MYSWTDKIKWVFWIIILAVLLFGCSSDQVTDTEQEEPDPDPISLEGKLAVHYLNLIIDGESKPGDAIIIQTPGGVAMMIDAGRTQAGGQIDRYLDDLDIQAIDHAVTTHPHVDHIGGFLTLVETKEIRQFIMPNVYHVATPHRELNERIEELEIDLEYMEAGDYFFLDEEEIKVEFFSPPYGTEPPNETDINTINDLSLVLKVTYGDTRFLFTSDIGMGIESDLILNFQEELQADLLHVPHHGLETSSSLNFIQTVDPEIVVFSGNREYSERVYNRYDNHGSDIYVTSRDGHLIFVSDGEVIEVVK